MCIVLSIFDNERSKVRNIATITFPILFFVCVCTNSHDEMKTQWEHPKTGKKKRCAGGTLYSVLQCLTCTFICLRLCMPSNAITIALQPGILDKCLVLFSLTVCQGGTYIFLNDVTLIEEKGIHLVSVTE